MAEREHVKLERKRRKLLWVDIFDPKVAAAAEASFRGRPQISRVDSGYFW